MWTNVGYSKKWYTLMAKYMYYDFKKKINIIMENITGESPRSVTFGVF